MDRKKISRRTFLGGAAAATVAAGCATVTRPQGPRRVPPSEKLNVAAIGAGGKGESDIGSCASENVVALCDVDDRRAAKTFARFPNAKRYRDFRVMLEKEKSIDAVTISTPDHTHAVAAMMAMSLGKHVYVQKPMTHSIYEARMLTEAARKYKVATQLGNQGHSGDGVRRLCEMIWSGAIGPVREAHIWTNRPSWPQGIKRPTITDPVPETLDWDLWLGPAPYRPYVKIHPDTGRECYCPFVWRGWWDFGCGALGDMACHIMDPAFWALKLTSPTSVEAVSEGGNDETAPLWSIIRYEFPQRGDMPPVTVIWYDGGKLPPRPEGIGPDVKLGEGDNGSLFIGDKGMATTGCYGDGSRLLPDSVMKDYKFPDPYIPRIPGGPYRDWIQACKGGRPACSNFDYSGPLTEMVLLGNLAVRSGKKIQWDPKNLRVTNVPEANQYVRREYRSGWSL